MALTDAVLGGTAVALVIWLAKVPGDVLVHDRLIKERDEDLATWLADEKLRVDRRLEEILEELSPQGLLWSGQRLFLRAREKERACTHGEIRKELRAGFGPRS